MDLKSLNEIDLRNLGDAPLAARVGIAVLLLLVILGAGYWFLGKAQLERFEAAQRSEQQLRNEFELKQRRAANLGAYQAQTEEMERMFASLVQLLPSSAEIPSLLEDISQAALAAGVEIELFDRRPEVRQTFYARVPIQLRVRGGYEALAGFVSTISAMPRIVTVHDLHLRPAPGGRSLLLDLEARTYRFVEDA
jgi:type IV pilus assembly protein PilO